MSTFQEDAAVNAKRQTPTLEDLIRLAQPSSIQKKTAPIKFETPWDLKHKQVTIANVRFDGQKSCFPIFNDENITFENCEFTNCSGIRDLKLQNFGPLKNVEWSDLDNFNVIVGRNGLGKSFLLRALYCALKSSETFKRGDEPRKLDDILTEQLYWTFQTNPIDNLITRNQDEPLKFSASFIGYDRPFSYELSKDADKVSLLEGFSKSEGNAIFIPAQDVFSLYSVIVKNRWVDVSFGFSEPSVHLATALTSPQINNPSDKRKEFEKERALLQKTLQGRFVFVPESRRWFFDANGGSRYEMGTVAEGVKKLGMLDVLLGNGYLKRRSVLLVDEPEANLNPVALYDFMDVLWSLAHSGVQVFIATHSYFVLKKANVLATFANEDVSLGILDESGEFKTDNLLHGIPSNDITDETIKLYNESINFSFDFGESQDD